MSLISTPLHFNKVEPNNWAQWWDLWNKESDIVIKAGHTHNNVAARWRGVDIYVKDGIDVVTETQYSCKNLNCPDLFNTIFDNIHLLPLDVQIVRAVSSMSAVGAHHDAAVDKHMIRTMLYDDNPKPSWYYLDSKYKRTYQQLPPDTNTWLFMDKKAKHGTDFHPGHSKILLCYYGVSHPHAHKIPGIEQEAKIRYPEYMIYES